jgi:hypothetical protein
MRVISNTTHLLLKKTTSNVSRSHRPTGGDFSPLTCGSLFMTLEREVKTRNRLSFFEIYFSDAEKQKKARIVLIHAFFAIS